MKLLRRLSILFILTLGASAALAEDPAAEASAYRSPYSVEFTHPLAELTGDLDRTERGDFRIEAEIPHAQWYSRATRERWESWGPQPRSYPPPEGIERRGTIWKRERMIAVALRFRGYGYQHHHIPDWNPPADWPWKKTAVGHNGKGVDCSNFTGFVANLGFGLRLHTDIHKQAEQRTAEVHGTGRVVPLRYVDLPADYAARVAALRTGDMLFIRNGAGNHISHVVLWVGNIGRSPDGVPLILDSHGDGVKDANGVHIPAGIQLRPYHERSWYHHEASHALRLFEGEELP